MTDLEKHDLDLLMKSAQQIAEEAGEVLARGALAPRNGVETKRSIMDIVTATDKAAESLIVECIRSAFPDDAVLGEEGTEYSGTTGRRWIIDPLDGTANFVHGWRVSAVSIGVEIDGRFMVGVVFNPFQNEMFVAATGKGAYLNGRRLQISDEMRDWNAAYVGIDGGYDADVRQERIHVITQVVDQGGDVRILGSTALGLSYVACGRFDAHFNRGSSIWDVAAGTVIAREAGYRVEGYRPGSEPTAERCLAARPELLDTLRSVVEAAAVPPLNSRC